jgi:glycerate 2-kinase
VERALSADLCRSHGCSGACVIAAGKAAFGMASAARRILGAQARRGLIIAPFAAPVADGFDALIGGHPVPTAGSERARARDLGSDELLLVLLSGGASAAMAVPADGLSLQEKREATSRLLRAGADIHSLNTVRKHLSGIKGGQLAAATPAPCVTLAISDVVGDDLSVIGSGPTVADASTFADALKMLERFGGFDQYPRSVVTRFMAGARGELPDTPKPADQAAGRSAARVIGSRTNAMLGAEEHARALGYHVREVSEAVVGDARISSARHLRAVLTGAADMARPACIVSSGETTVHVTGNGKGGRNQEFALATAECLAAADVHAAVASIGTDGVDGPTDAAGAIADATTLRRARQAGLSDPAEYFEQNNTYELFSRLGDLIHTGPTGTNVGDLQVVLIG